MNNLSVSRLSSSLFYVGLLVGVAHAQQMARTCQFRVGPRAGKSITFLAFPPIPVGSPCNDGVSSTGIIVPDNPHPQITHACQFDQGPRSGQTQIYPQTIQVGALCWDGISSSGISIPDASSGPPSVPDEQQRVSPAPVPPTRPSTDLPPSASNPTSEQHVPAVVPVPQQSSGPGQAQRSARPAQSRESHPPQTSPKPVPAQEAGISSALSPSPSELASFRHASFAQSALINALYDEDFSLLNKDRINSLSYTAGILIFLANNTNNNTSCPNPVHLDLSFDAHSGRALDDVAANFVLQFMASPYGISLFALIDGREYRKDYSSAAKAVFDVLGLANGTAPDISATAARGGERGIFTQAGNEDAKYLLAHYGGCSGTLFKRVYSGLERFALREAPIFRSANASPELRIRIAVDKDNYQTEQSGFLVYGYSVLIVNGDQLPQELYVLQSWQGEIENTSAPPDVAPIIIQLFSSDGKPMGAVEPDTFTVSDLKRGVIYYSASPNFFPDKVYLEIYDAKHDKVYRSALNIVPTSPTAPLPQSAPSTQPTPGHSTGKK